MDALGKTAARPRESGDPVLPKASVAHIALDARFRGHERSFH